ncbi:MAG: hypothetical protein PUF50_03040 [Erysipelotrichaceae bacterium]|nr:hypothetical protein [Erysipelotrichaceae bacterium]
MSKQIATYIEQEEVINRSWISVIDFMKLVPVGTNAARKAVNSIIDEMDQNGEPRFKTKPLLVPTSKVVKAYKIDVNTIRREAERMRKAKGEKVVC